MLLSHVEKRGFVWPTHLPVRHGALRSATEHPVAPPWVRSRVGLIIGGFQVNFVRNAFVAFGGFVPPIRTLRLMWGNADLPQRRRGRRGMQSACLPASAPSASVR